MQRTHEHRFSQNAKRMRASEIRELLKLTQRPEVISFAGGLPSPDAFPIAQLREVVEHVMDEHPRDALQYGATEGHNKLRDAIARGMGTVHDTPQSIHNILITHGSQQALSLLSHILLDPGDTVVTGAPSFLGAVLTFGAFQAQIESVPLDDQGINVEMLEAKLDSLAGRRRLPKFLYVMPTFQNPTGSTIPLDRRKRIYELVRKYDLLLVEDDPYGFLRYEGEKIPLVKSLDKEDRVVYLGTFSKILAPGFRIAWMAAPESIVNKVGLAKQAQDLCSNTFAQYCIFEAMYRNVLFPHIDEIVRIYKEKRDTMLAAMDRHFPKQARWNRPEGGLFLWVMLPPFIDTR
ncbi:MAG: aminotransferase-like domain-containing protein, partial [Planctomycetota bacterium]